MFKIWEMLLESFPSAILQISLMITLENEIGPGLFLSILLTLLSIGFTVFKILFLEHRAQEKVRCKIDNNLIELNIAERDDFKSNEDIAIPTNNPLLSFGGDGLKIKTNSEVEVQIANHHDMNMDEKEEEDSTNQHEEDEKEKQPMSPFLKIRFTHRPFYFDIEYGDHYLNAYVDNIRHNNLKSNGLNEELYIHKIGDIVTDNMNFGNIQSLLQKQPLPAFIEFMEKAPEPPKKCKSE